MLTVKFHTYCGLAGDEHQLLVGTSNTGQRVSRLYNRCIFPLRNLKRTKKKILKEFELLTGQTSIEG